MSIKKEEKSKENPFYPLKFSPIYKSYLWGGRALESIGKKLPKGVVAESWEVACHPKAVSTIANGAFRGKSLQEIIEIYRGEIIGKKLPKEDLGKFPLLIKLLDSNQKISIQVHPNDQYAKQYEDGALGKNEMWYILKAKPGAKLIYGIKPEITKENFAEYIQTGRTEEALNFMEVFAGDIVNIPAGTVHGTSDGTVIYEVQQSSDLTYRIYDYNRTDADGHKRELHIDKALDVIDFGKPLKKAKGLTVPIGKSGQKSIRVVTPYFAVELYDLNGPVLEEANGDRFYIYTVTEGNGTVRCLGHEYTIHQGETFFIPAALGAYVIEGQLKCVKTYVPSLDETIEMLRGAGYAYSQIYENVVGLEGFREVFTED